MIKSLDDATFATSAWLRHDALPLWADRGFDALTGAFEEQLDFSGSPVTTVPRRLMVQARQIATFSAAALSGRYPDDGRLALSAAEAMIRTYYMADGAPGWVFSVGRDGRIVDGRRDLYAHAFVLFSLAWVMRLERSRLFEQHIDATLSFLDRSLADPVHGGYWDCLPRSDRLRRQNPHMHLFEAFIALFETTRNEDILARCRTLRDLAIGRFLDLRTGALREYYDDTWKVVPGPGAGSVEPGHLFEWAWLLRRYETLSGEDQAVPVQALLAMALQYGISFESGRIVDEIAEDGRVRQNSSRLWPHAEALKALSAEASRYSNRYCEIIVVILQRLIKVHCPADLFGGWIDHVDTDDQSISAIMPASSFYHIYFGLAAVEPPPG